MQFIHIITLMLEVQAVYLGVLQRLSAAGLSIDEGDVGPEHILGGMVGPIFIDDLLPLLVDLAVGELPRADHQETGEHLRGQG